MTQNTKTFQIKPNGLTIRYRTLTAGELCFLDNINNDVYRQEFAAKLAIIEPTDTTDIPWPVLLQIGASIYVRSSNVMSDKVLFEVTVKEFRNKLEKDEVGPMSLIGEILKAFPGQQVTELMKLTYEDLIELVCLVEKLSGRQLFTVGSSPFGKKKGVKLIDPKNLPDDGKSLKQKMSELNAHLGTPRL